MATPTISSVSGTLTHGETITLSVANEGTSPLPLLLWEDFSTGTVGNNLNASPQVGTWALNTIPTAKYNDTQVHRVGGKTAYANRTDAVGEWSNFNVEDVAEAPHFYQTFWFRYALPNLQGPVKLSQVHGSVGNFTPGVGIGDLSGGNWQWYIQKEDTGFVQDSCSNPSEDAWHHFEWILKESSPNTANGNVIAKIDTVAECNQVNIITRQTSAHWYLFEFFTGITGFDLDNEETWIADCYLNDSWARVEIGDNAAYASCTHREIQRPLTWASGAITFQLNTGSFANDATVYVFVINDTDNGTDGERSSGFEITLGGEGGGGEPGTTAILMPQILL